MGKPRKSMNMSEESRRATAIHEAGHALLAYYLEDADPLHKVTIIPHGRALGLTMQLPEDDKYSWSKKENLARIQVLFGGYIAEKMFYGIEGTSTGVSNDLMRAKQIAETMVKDYGMGSVGPVYFGSTDAYGNRGADTSDLAKEEFDEAVKEIMDDALRSAERLLKEKREHIVILTNMLLEQDTVLADELEGMFGILDTYFEEDE
jgi:cell division protease FtsH